MAKFNADTVNDFMAAAKKKFGGDELGRPKRSRISVTYSRMAS